MPIPSRIPISWPIPWLGALCATPSPGPFRSPPTWTRWPPGHSKPMHEMPCHGMAWHAMARRGRPRNAMRWRGIPSHSMLWNGVQWHGMAWHGILSIVVQSSADVMKRVWNKTTTPRQKRIGRISYMCIYIYIYIVFSFL